MNNRNSHLGIFIAGYRWSGSGAVGDWLAGHDGLCRVEGSEAAFGEIRALNYGLKYLFQTAAERIHYGEKLGRWALCPDPRKWDEVLGPPLTRERGKFAGLYGLADALYFSAARFHVIPGVKKYRDLLDAQLAGDFREDKEYLRLVDDLVSVLREWMKNRYGRSEEVLEYNNSVRLAASRLLSLFYRRLGGGSKALIFDNAISGMNPELFHLLHPSIFPGQIIILVRRDPRDQFAELVKYSGSTFSWSAGHFIRQYRSVQEKTIHFLDEASGESGFSPSGKDWEGARFIRRISFESFVLNRNDARTRLKDDLQEFWKPFGVREQEVWKEGHPGEEVADGMNRLFNPGSSRVNIGIWRDAGLDRQMERISGELAEYIEEFNYE